MPMCLDFSSLSCSFVRFDKLIAVVVDDDDDASIDDDDVDDDDDARTLLTIDSLTSVNSAGVVAM